MSEGTQLHTEVLEAGEAGAEISTASRVRQMVVTIVVLGGGIYAAVYQALSWPLVVLLLGGLWAYTAKSVLQQVAAAAVAYYQSRTR